MKPSRPLSYDNLVQYGGELLIPGAIIRTKGFIDFRPETITAIGIKLQPHTNHPSLKDLVFYLQKNGKFTASSTMDPAKGTLLSLILSTLGRTEASVEYDNWHSYPGQVEIDVRFQNSGVKLENVRDLSFISDIEFEKRFSVPEHGIFNFRPEGYVLSLRKK